MKTKFASLFAGSRAEGSQPIRGINIKSKALNLNAR
jgi:hypothetical protein